MLLRPLQDEVNRQDNRPDYQLNKEGQIILKTMIIIDEVKKKKGDIIIIMVGVPYRLPPERYRKLSHAFAGHTLQPTKKMETPFFYDMVSELLMAFMRKVQMTARKKKGG